MKKNSTSLREQASKKKVRLPMHWQQLNEQEKGWLSSFKDTSEMNITQVRKALNIMTQSKNHFQAMFYVEYKNKRAYLKEHIDTIQSLRNEIHELKYKYDSEYRKVDDELPF